MASDSHYLQPAGSGPAGKAKGKFMIPSSQLLAQLKRHEGFYARPYLCTKKACTIGYGTNLDAHPKYIPYDDIRRMTRQGILSGATLKNALLKRGMVWSEQQAEAAMREELDECRASLGRRCIQYCKLVEINDEPRAEVLLNMAFNLGVAGLLKFRNTLAILDGAIAGKRSYADVAKGMLNSAWARQVKGRARQLAKQMETGVYQ